MSKREIKDRQNRSSKYQHLILEAPYASEVLETFSTEDSIFSRLNPFHYDDKLIDLQDQLKKRFWELVEENLTERQQEVLRLISKGFTQQEASAKLFVNQSSIVKSLAGNVDYKNCKKNKDGKPTGQRKYGGSIKKLTKIIETDIEMQGLLSQINDIIENKW